jgi:hypothetical protein
MNTATASVEEIVTEMRRIEWRLNTYYPNEARGTTHARRLARIKRDRSEDEAMLSRLTTELGAKLQEERF